METSQNKPGESVLSSSRAEMEDLRDVVESNNINKAFENDASRERGEQEICNNPLLLTHESLNQKTMTLFTQPAYIVANNILTLLNKMTNKKYFHSLSIYSWMLERFNLELQTTCTTSSLYELVTMDELKLLNGNDNSNHVLVLAKNDEDGLCLFGYFPKLERNLLLEQSKKQKINTEIIDSLIGGQNISFSFKETVYFDEKLNIEFRSNIIRRELNPKEGCVIYFDGKYLNTYVFIKISCYKTYVENEECMNYLKNIKSKYLNEIIEYKKLKIDKNDLISIYKLTREQIDVLQLKDEIYTSILSPTVIWYDYFIANYSNIYPLNNLNNCKTILLLILKLFIDNLNGLKELHLNNIIHIDFNILNSNILIDNSNNSLNDVINTYLESVNLPKFNMVLIDFNSSRMEHQELFSEFYIPKSTHYPSDYKLLDQDKIPKIAFTKAHDIYSLSVVMTQYIDILLTCYGKSDYLMKSFVIRYINHSHNQKKDSDYNIFNVLQNLRKQLNNIMLGNQLYASTLNELFEIIEEMNQYPWKCTNEFSFYFEKLINLQNNIINGNNTSSPEK